MTKMLRKGDVFMGINGLVAVIKISVVNNTYTETYNLEVKDFHNYLVGNNGIIVHNKSKTSKFDLTTKKKIRIYEVYDIKTKEVKYVGQTDRDVQERFKEHCKEGKKKGNHKKNWQNKYRAREVKSGNWTPYEASVWEQHYIEKNGGKGKLQNKRNEISKKKYDKYKYKHNPCK